MNPIEFLKTIYISEDYCKKLIIDIVRNRLEIHMSSISRIRDTSGNWNYYTDEDIENGIIVIDGIIKILFDKSGLMPNDEIYNIYAKKIDTNIYEFIIEASYGDNNLISHNITIKVIASKVYLLDPCKPEDIIDY